MTKPVTSRSNTLGVHGINLGLSTSLSFMKSLRKFDKREKEKPPNLDATSGILEE